MIRKNTRYRFALNVLQWFVILAVLQFGSATFAQQGTRTWTDNSGSFSVEAELVGINQTHATLKKPNGSMIQVPLNRLSKFDVDYIRKLQSSQRDTNNSLTKRSVDNSETHPSGTLSPANSRADEIRTKQQRKQSFGSESAAKTGTPTLLAKSSEKRELSESRFLMHPNDPSSGLGKSNSAISEREIDLLPQPYRAAAQMIEESNGRTVIREGLTKLESNWPRQELPTLTKLVLRLTSSEDAKIRSLAISLLAANYPRESLGLILSGIDDENFSLRWQCYQLLEQIGDPRAIDRLVQKLDSDDRDRAASILVSFGSSVQSQVLPYIRHETEQTRVTACSVIGKIGTPECIPALEAAAAGSKTIKVRMQANHAIKQIIRRQQSDK